MEVRSGLTVVEEASRLIRAICQLLVIALTTSVIVFRSLESDALSLEETCLNRALNIFIRGVRYLNTRKRKPSYEDRYLHTKRDTFIRREIPSYEERYLHSKRDTFIRREIPSFEERYLHTKRDTFIRREIPSYEERYLHTKRDTFIRREILSYEERYLHTKRDTFIRREIPS